MYHWAADAYPEPRVAAQRGWDNFVIIELGVDRTIAEMDYRSTHTMLHEQAIYQHEGEQYQVERLDFENHKAYVRKVAPDYFTTAMTYTRVEVLEEQETTTVGDAPPVPASAGLGEVSVIEKVVGYKKIKFHTHENVGYGDVRLPEMQMHTTAFWFLVPEVVVQALPYARPTVVDALRGFGNALHTVSAVGLMIDPRDLGHTLGDRTDENTPPGKRRGGAPGFDPTLFCTTTCRVARGSRRGCLRRGKSCCGARVPRSRVQLSGGVSGLHRAGDRPGGHADRRGHRSDPERRLAAAVIADLLDALGIRTVH